jgi:hypothetical protein
MTAMTATCPDWNHLAALRTPQDTEPEGWALALEHFDGCTRCRPAALKADPLLVFRRLPVTELAPAEERSEVESVCQAVAAMRTASRLESRRRFAGWHRWAAAAVLTFASLAVGRDLPSSAEMTAANAAIATNTAGIVAPPVALPVRSLDQDSALEDLNRPGARVYHLSGEGLKAYMIIDEKFDV